ncbi:MAG: hypothetical protein H6581_24395 [Bacteroidia bacterium]|nr:hypothetical protein [Bacteroidia bacterium]
MSEKLKNIIEKSGKKGTVSFKGKENRTSFDESFGRKKVELVKTLIGSEENFNSLNEKLNSV